MLNRTESVQAEPKLGELASYFRACEVDGGSGFATGTARDYERLAQIAEKSAHELSSGDIREMIMMVESDYDAVSKIQTEEPEKWTGELKEARDLLLKLRPVLNELLTEAENSHHLAEAA